MISTDTLVYRTLSEVPPGNLVSLEDDRIAICVLHPAGEMGGESKPALIVLFEDSKRGPLPLTYAGQGHVRCLDWGVKPVFVWRPGVAATSGENLPATGWLEVVDDRVTLTSHYNHGHGYRLHWDIKSGELVDVANRQVFRISHWQLGVKGPTGAFIKLVEYPNDYLAKKAV